MTAPAVNLLCLVYANHGKPTFCTFNRRIILIAGLNVGVQAPGGEIS